MANETAFLGNIREIGRGMMRKKTEMENKKIDNENHLYVKEIFPWGCCSHSPLCDCVKIPTIRPSEQAARVKEQLERNKGIRTEAAASHLNDMKVAWKAQR